MTTAEDAAAQIALFDDVLATAQRLVKAEKDKSKITPAYIAEKVKLAAATFASDPPIPLDEAKVVATLIQRFSHWMGKATTCDPTCNATYSPLVSQNLQGIRQNFRLSHQNYYQITTT